MHSIPGAALRGNYVIVVDVVDTNNSPLMCVDLHVHVTSAAPSTKSWLHPPSFIRRMGDRLFGRSELPEEVHEVQKVQ